MRNFRKFLNLNKRNNLGLFFRSMAFAAVLTALLFALPVFSTSVYAQSGGPLVLMGIDAEDGGPGGHGPTVVYVDITNSIYTAAANGGTGILVVGGGKSSTDNVTRFWNAISTASGIPVTYVNGGTNITNQSFAGFRMIAVTSDVTNTPSGGLSPTEHTAFVGRAGDVANFINNGGGLLGFSSQFANPYAYLSNVGTFSIENVPQYPDITPTQAGLDIGVTNALDVCCWHQIYSSFPPFLTVLATRASGGGAAAIGSVRAFIGSIQLSPPTAMLPVGSLHTLTALVAENNLPIPNRSVTLTVVSGPNIGQTYLATTDATGTATFVVTSAVAGTDTFQASYVDSQNVTRSSNQVTAEWTGQVCPTITLDPTPLSDGAIGASYSQSVTANGGTDPYTYSVTAGSLPSGLSLDANTGEISGTPTAGGTFNFTITATDANKCTGSENYSIFVVYRCPLSQGYWKNHPQAWAINSLTLGLETYTNAELLGILQTPVGSGRGRSDASLILAYQLIAAKLNIANGSDPAPVSMVIHDADHLLENYIGKLPYSVSTSSADGQQMIAMARILDSYNTRQLTPNCVP